jgi:hypothetical protein
LTPPAKLAVDGDGFFIVAGDGFAGAGDDSLPINGFAGNGTLVYNRPVLDDGRPGTRNYINTLAMSGPGFAKAGGRFWTTAHTNLSFTSSNLIIDGDVTSLVEQADGQTLVAGNFGVIGTTPRSGFARIASFNTVDPVFTAPLGAGASCLALQADGKILVGNQSGAGSVLLRLSNTPATQSLTVTDAHRVQWLRGGSSPVVILVEFDLSTDGGGNWTPLGTGISIGGGWELTGLNLPPGGSIRARARTASDSSYGQVKAQTQYSLLATASEAWRLQFFGTTDNTGIAADLSDPDGDGIVNLMEFATGSNPVTVTAPPGMLLKNGADLEFTYTRLIAALTEVTDTVEWSESLTGTWSSTGVSGPMMLSDDGITQEVKSTLPAGAGGKRFVRLRIARK